MDKKKKNIKVYLKGEILVSEEDIKNMPRHTIRHFSFVDELEIKQTAARDLWDRTTNNKK